MTSITDLDPMAFRTGVEYERCRILDSLRLELEQITIDGELTIQISDLLLWMTAIIGQPLHDPTQAQHVMRAGTQVIRRQAKELMRDPDIAAYVEKHFGATEGGDEFIQWLRGEDG